jgi:hypothetical protein
LVTTLETRAELILTEADELRQALQASGEAGYFARREALRVMVQREMEAAVNEYRMRVLRAVVACSPWTPSAAEQAVRAVPLDTEAEEHDHDETVRQVRAKHAEEAP